MTEYTLDTSKTAFFTGHREVSTELIPLLESHLDRVLRRLYELGYRYFMAGGALGFDTLAAEAVARLRGELTDIQLILALPCRNQTELWDIDDVRHYHFLKSKADRVLYVSDRYHPDAMRERNQFMADRSSFCVAYYSGTFRSGTGMTYRMAQKRGIQTYNIYDTIHKKNKI